MSRKSLSVFPLLLALTFLMVYTSFGSKIVQIQKYGPFCETPYGKVKNGESLYIKKTCEKIECAYQAHYYHWTCPHIPKYENEYCWYMRETGKYPDCCKVSLVCT